MTIKWNEATKSERYYAHKAAKKAIRLYQPEEVDQREVFMDLIATHVSGCKLDLKRLADEFDDFNLMHDVAGINRHLDRSTGELQHCFRPRCAA